MRSDADRALEVHRERRLHRLQHARRAGFLAFFDVDDEILVVRTHVIDRAATRHARRQVALVQALVEHEHAARARSAKELVRRQEHGIVRRITAVRIGRGVHVDLDVRRAGRVVEARVRIVRVQQPRNLARGRAHARDVRSRRERTDAQPPLVFGQLQQVPQVLDVHAAIRGEIHFDHGRQPLAPGDFVAVMLVRPHEDHRLLRLLEAPELLELRLAHEGPQLVADDLARGGRQGDAQDLLQLVDRARCTRAARHDPTLRPRVDRALDGALRFVQQPAHAAAGEVVFGVGIGVDALQLLQVLLDEEQAATRRRVVAVHHQAAAERRVEGGVDADDLRAQEVEGQWRVHRSILPLRPNIQAPRHERLSAALVPSACLPFQARDKGRGEPRGARRVSAFPSSGQGPRSDRSGSDPHPRCARPLPPSRER